jgi:hypothetical protein
MSAPAWTDVGLFWISVVAFATSAVSIVLSIVQFKLTGGVVKVSIATAKLISSYEATDVVTITAVNVGRVPVTITSVGMMAATGRCRA